MKLRDILREPERTGEPGAPGDGTSAAAAATEPQRQFDRLDDEPAPEPAAKPEKTPSVAPEVLELRKQMDTLTKEQGRETRETRQQIKELEATAKFWQEQAQASAGNGKAAKEDPAESDAGGDIDIVEALASGDKANIRRYMKSVIGLTSTDELPELSEQLTRKIETRIKGERTAIAEESAVYKMFPDLESNDTPLFQKTREIYLGYAKSDFGKSPQALKLAALEAAAELGIVPGAKQQPKAKEPEAERIERVAAQEGGQPRTRRTDAGAEGDDDELSPSQKRICSQLGVSEKRYRERARSGQVKLGSGSRGLGEALAARGRAA